MLNLKDKESLDIAIKFLELENLNFTELKKLMIDMDVRGKIDGAYIWGTLARHINEYTKHPSRKKYKNYVFKGFYNGDTHINQYMLIAYIDDMVEVIKDEDGGGVDGTICELIIKHKASDRYLFQSGEYDSYDGMVEYHSEWVEVKPFTVETIEFREV